MIYPFGSCGGREMAPIFSEAAHMPHLTSWDIPSVFLRQNLQYVCKKANQHTVNAPPADKSIFLALIGWCNTCLNDVNLPGKFCSDRTVISRHIANLSSRSLFGYAEIRTHDPCNTHTTWDTTKLFAPCHSQIICLCWCKIFSSPSLPFRSCDMLKFAKCLIFSDFPCFLSASGSPFLPPRKQVMMPLTSWPYRRGPRQSPCVAWPVWWAYDYSGQKNSLHHRRMRFKVQITIL